MVKVSLQHGLSGPSTHGFATWGLLLGGAFHRYGDGFRFAKLACDLVAKHDFITGHSKVYGTTAVVAGWAQPIAVAIDFARKGVRTAVEAGDTVMACYSGFAPYHTPSHAERSTRRSLARVGDGFGLRPASQIRRRRGHYR